MAPILYLIVLFFGCLCTAFPGGGSKVVGDFYLKFRARFWDIPSDLLGVVFSCHRVINWLTACLVAFLKALVRPLVTCFLGGSPKFSEGLLFDCKQCPVKSSLYLMVSFFREVLKLKKLVLILRK